MLASVVSVCAVAGCQQQMADQPSFKPLEPCEFFADGRSARPPVPGTVARGHWHGDAAFSTGRIAHASSIEVTSKPKPPAATEDAQARNPNTDTPTQPQSAANSQPSSARFTEDDVFTQNFPIAIDESTIQFGHDRYTIYCVVCHDSLGTGRGKIVERGYTAPPSFHIDRLRNAPVGRLFAVVTEGYGSMPAYGAEIPTEDRWAIVAYLRALQLSQHFPTADLTDRMRSELAPAQQAASPKQQGGSATGGSVP